MKRHYHINKKLRYTVAFLLFLMQLPLKLYHPYSNNSVLSQLISLPSYNLKQLEQIVPIILLIMLCYVAIALIVSWVITAIVTILISRH